MYTKILHDTIVSGLFLRYIGPFLYLLTFIEPKKYFDFVYFRMNVSNFYTITFQNTRFKLDLHDLKKCLLKVMKRH